MLTYAPTTTPSWGSGVTPATIVPPVINYYLNGNIVFDLDVKNIVVGYAAVKNSTGIEITKAVIDYNDEVDVYNLSGIRIAYGRLSSMQLPTGIYIVRQGTQTKKILITSHY